jgi:hypothetical protein
MLSGRGKAGWGIDNHGYHEADMIGAVEGDAPRERFLDLGFGQLVRRGLEEAAGGGRPPLLLFGCFGLHCGLTAETRSDHVQGTDLLPYALNSHQPPATSHILHLVQNANSAGRLFLLQIAHRPSVPSSKSSTLHKFNHSTRAFQTLNATTHKPYTSPRKQRFGFQKTIHRLSLCFLFT